MGKNYAETARILLEVTAGVLPGEPEPKLTRQWAITDAQWSAEDVDKTELLAAANGKMQGYAMLLMLQPDRFNWVKTEWIYL